jgi:hypothetical protein
MADFPRSIGVHMTSTDSTLDDAMVSRSRAGRIRMRRLFVTPVKEFHVVLKGLTDTERDVVQNFLVANRKLPFGFFWPYGGGVFQVIWTDSAIVWMDEGAKLSSTNLTFAVVN